MKTAWQDLRLLKWAWRHASHRQGFYRGIGSVLLLFSAQPAIGQCIVADSHVVSVDTVNAAFMSDSAPHRLGSPDSCTIKIHPDLGIQSFGLEIEVDLSLPLPDPVKIHVNFYSAEPMAAPVELYVKHSDQSFDRFKRWSLEPDGTTDKIFNLSHLASNLGTDISRYIHSGSHITFRLMAFPVMLAGSNCDESYEFDCGDKKE